MDIDEDDDLYVPEEPKVDQDEKKPSPKPDDLEEGEEEDEGGAMDEDSDDDSDIDIITERKDGTKAEPPSQSKYSDIRNIPQRTATSDSPVKAAIPPPKKEEDSRGHAALNVAAPSADQTSEAASKSTIDINANPVYPGAGKPISQVNIDEDLPDNDKPWRKPGTDISDYFNYGFDEFTWALYAAKQDAVRGEFGADAFASNNKKMMEDFNNMMMGGMGMGGGAGGAGGAGAGANPGAGGMPGMEGMPPEMQAMMQQMMASGMDPSQMDPSQMGAMFAGMQNGGGAGGAAGGGQGQGGFGGGYGGNQGGYGYDQNMGGGGGGGGGGRGGFGGGRGRRGRW